MIKAKIIGASGYGGIGVSELLLSHPEAEIVALVGVDPVDVPISDVYPHLSGYLDMPILAADAPEAQVDADVVFMATPDRVGMQLAQSELDKGAKVIDFSGDFRFNTPETYSDYATRIGLAPDHLAPALLSDSVYGLTELHRDALKAGPSVVGNPGCFAVSCLLGLAPAVAAKLVTPDSIICDCKTGVSGAGKKASAAFHFPARHENMNAYRLSGHQHVCEIEHELSLLSGTDFKVTFTAQVVPMTRGIMTTLYGTLSDTCTEADVLDIYRKHYANDPFVRVFSSDSGIGTAHVRGSNRCLLMVSVDERTRRLRIVSHIDNLMKGQAGSAVQNMNVLFGCPETMGLDRPGNYP
jgi:N-acetyl-gamma-glutamyl-phosphate reductase